MNVLVLFDIISNFHADLRCFVNVKKVSSAARIKVSMILS